MKRPDIDLVEDRDYRVRILRLADDAHPAGVVYFEGITRFTLRPLPRFRGIPGPRYEIVPTAHDLGRGWQYPTNYRSGDFMIGDGTYGCILLDRYTEPNVSAVVPFVHKWFAQHGMEVTK